MSSAPQSTQLTGTRYDSPYGPPPPTARRRAGIGVAVGIVFSLLLVAAGSLWVASLLARQEATRETLVSEPFSSVVIASGSGDVHVQALGVPGALVEQRLRWSFTEPTVTTSVSDGVLVIRAACATSGFGLPCSVDLVVHVPPATPTTVETGAGDVDVWGVAAAVALKTGSGDIGLLGVDGAVQARTGSGDISLVGVTGGVVTASTGSGDVEVSVDTAPDNLTVRTGSGDVDVWLPEGDAAYAADVTAGSGDRRVDVRTDPNSSRSISAHTGSGDVTVAYR